MVWDMFFLVDWRLGGAFSVSSGGSGEQKHTGDFVCISSGKKRGQGDNGPLYRMDQPYWQVL